MVVPADHAGCGLLPPPRHRLAGHQGDPPLLLTKLLGFTLTAPREFLTPQSRAVFHRPNDWKRGPGATSFESCRCHIFDDPWSVSPPYQRCEVSGIISLQTPANYFVRFTCVLLPLVVEHVRLSTDRKL